jgi:hypothetical protein
MRKKNEFPVISVEQLLTAVAVHRTRFQPVTHYTPPPQFWHPPTLDLE